MFSNSRVNALFSSIGRSTGMGLAAILDAIQSGDDDMKLVTPAVSTAGAYSAGQVLFNPVEVANAVSSNGGLIYVKGITVIDTAAQGAALDLWAGINNTALGSATRATPDISAANALSARLQMVASLGASDFKSIGPNVKIATRQDLTFQFKADSASTSMWLSAVSQGAPTFGSASNLTILLSLFSR